MILKDSIDSDSIINTTSESVSISSGEMSMATHKTYGNFILGPLSITSPFTNVKFASGMFRFNSLLLSTMPSTIITPIPVFEFETPVKALAGFASISKMILSSV